jgi:hypothetical protein
VVLIPVVVPEHFRFRILHNQIDHVLSAALRTRTDVVVARVPMPLRESTDSRVLALGDAKDVGASGASNQMPTGDEPH